MYKTSLKTFDKSFADPLLMYKIRVKLLKNYLSMQKSTGTVHDKVIYFFQFILRATSFRQVFPNVNNILLIHYCQSPDYFCQNLIQTKIERGDEVIIFLLFYKFVCMFIYFSQSQHSFVSCVIQYVYITTHVRTCVRTTVIKIGVGNRHRVTCHTNKSLNISQTICY